MSSSEVKNYSWMNPALEVRSTAKYGGYLRRVPSYEHKRDKYVSVSGEGRGVFARNPINKGEALFVMGGFVLTIEDENQLPDGLSDKPIEISPHFSIGPRSDEDIPRMPQHYVNHSCDPNAGFDGQIVMLAMRDIAEGEEISFDYAMVMHPNELSDSYFTFKCKCGATCCRFTVTEEDWMLPELQRKYDGYFSHFLQKKISKARRGEDSPE